MEILVFMAIAIIAVAILAVVVDFTVGLGTVVEAAVCATRSFVPSPSFRQLVDQEVARREHKKNEEVLYDLHRELLDQVFDLPGHIATAITGELREIRFQHSLKQISINKAVKQTDRVEYELNRALNLLK